MVKKGIQLAISPLKDLYILCHEFYYIYDKNIIFKNFTISNVSRRLIVVRHNKQKS